MEVPQQTTRTGLSRIGALATVALALAGGSAVAGPLNDTGIDFCVDHATGAQIPVTTTTTCADGQDARYGRDPAAQRGALTKVGGGSKGFDFTKIANNGSVLPATATLGAGPNDWACTYDNNTGLMWEVKVDDPAHLRHWQWLYRWYDSVHNYGGNPGDPAGTSCLAGSNCNTQQYVADVNSSMLCGHVDWRLPTGAELVSIADLGGNTGTFIDAAWFPNSHNLTPLWTSSPVVSDSTAAWLVDFLSATSQLKRVAARSLSRSIRAVRVGG